MQVTKRVLSKIAMPIIANESQYELKLERAICVSSQVRDLLVEAGLPVQHARIIHGGTDVERFNRVHKREERADNLKMVYAGQLAQHKGVHTAIEAMARLVNRHAIDRVTLTLVGSGHPDYEAFLHSLVDREGLHRYVTFHEPVSKDKMPDILPMYDVLVFPSIYEEPLARVVQEAMASGLVVVGTTTGGTKEILRDGETGFTFEPEDADRLAEHIVGLLNDPQWMHRLAQAGRQTVLENFTLERMVHEIEGYLLECLAESSQPDYQF
jgi:glycosyltransferase involved in cell wall biosynthesis